MGAIMKYSKYNVIIVGSGLSGLYLANRLADKGNFTDGILIVTKEELFSGSTSLAQGGIVSVIPEINKYDSIESHIKDTITSGCGLNDINTVRFVSENSSTIAQELIAMGVEFDKNKNNMLNFTLEGAHSVPRILHSNGDSTGQVIEDTLCKRIETKSNIDIYTNTMAVELLKDNNNCIRGIISYNCLNNSYEAIYSNAVVIATGGIGQLYDKTTNPSASTGDGIALAINAGAKVDNMEFVQFHPTGLYCKNSDITPLVSESVRGEGAKLVNTNGEYFAKNYHKKGDLAPRDIVARAIQSEILRTNSEYVNLDISAIGAENFKKRFPTITKLCNKNGIDITNGLIPVAPVQHYFMGGIVTDLNCKSTLENLYAIGECTMSGLHGANRLASNSLLECAVFAHKLSDDIIKNVKNPPAKQDDKMLETINKYSSIDTKYDDYSLVENLFTKLKNIMTNYVGIERNFEGLQEASVAISDIESAVNLNDCSYYRLKFELLNAITVAKEIINASIKRKESIGAHYRTDSAQQQKTENLEMGNNYNDKILA